MKVEIFGIADCEYCDKAKDMAGLGIITESNYIELSREEMKKRGYKTAPAIYVNDEFVGGFTELVNHVAHFSSLVCEAMHLCGVKGWEGYQDSIRLAKEWETSNLELSEEEL